MKAVITVMLGIISNSVLAGGLQDPRNRDEDVSGMNIMTKIDRTPDGQYRYIYTLTGGATAKGVVTDWLVDVNCPNMPDLGKQQKDGAGLTRDEDHSRDGRHVPLVSKLVGSPTQDSAFTASNEFMTAIMLYPAHVRKVELLSPNKPGYLHFSTMLSSGNEPLYDYAGFGETGGDIADLPWYEDWEVQGLIKGPACTGYEANPLTRPIFDGQLMPEERKEINQLLQYEVAGNRNRWHAPSEQTEVKLKVYYQSFIDPTSFKATLNGRDISALFHPGDTEVVTLPLEGPRTLIELSVLPNARDFQDAERYPTRRDIDPFEIRRDIP